MLTLLIPGVSMGGSGTGGSPATNDHLLTIMGIGRSWWIPFLLSVGAWHG